MAILSLRSLLGALAFLSAVTAQSADTRSFTSSDGRSLEGVLIQADEKSVMIERAADKRKFTIPVTSLSREDQIFIREWRQSKGNVRLSISATKRRSSRERKDEAAGGTTSVSSSRSTEETWYWEVKVTNQTKDPVDSIFLHYSQYVGVQDRNYPEKAIARESNGNLCIPAIPAFGSVTVRTADIQTFSKNAVSATERNTINGGTAIDRTSEKWKESLNGLNMEIYRKNSLITTVSQGSNADQGLRLPPQEREAWRSAEIAKLPATPSPPPPAKEN